MEACLTEPVYYMKIDLLDYISGKTRGSAVRSVT